MEKIKALLYCCKAKPYLWKYWFSGDNGNGYNYEISLSSKEWKDEGTILNSKIVAECDFEVEKIRLTKFLYLDDNYITNTLREKEILKYSCLSYCELADYLGGHYGYAIHIKNLHIFDKPINIRNYYNIAPRTMEDCMNQKTLLKAPQNMCNAYDVYKNHYIIISIKSEDLCKILNGEKTIMVRKKILNNMKGNE